MSAMQLSKQPQLGAVLRHFIVWAVSHLEFAVGVGFHGHPDEGPRGHHDDPECICSDLPILTTPAPVIPDVPTTLPFTPVEVITSDIELANKVWMDPPGLATKIAETLGVDPSKVVVVPKSWKTNKDDNPMYGPKPAVKGVGLLSNQRAISATSKKCECKTRAKTDKSEHDASRVMAVHDASRVMADTTYKISQTPTVNTSSGSFPTTVAAIDAKKATGPNVVPPPSYQIQMLTHDQCVVNQILAQPHVFESHIAMTLGINVSQVKVIPPLVEGGTAAAPGPAPGPVPAPALAASSAPAMGTPAALANAAAAAANATGPAPAPAPGPAPAPAPAPAAAAGATGNRPWIATWAVQIFPPNATEPTEKFLAAVNNAHGSLSRYLPMTFARLPVMPYPGFINNGLPNGTHSNWTILPPPPDTSIAIGYNPGGHRSGEMGDPLGPTKLMRDPEEIAETALHDAAATTFKIQDVVKRVENASEVHYEAMTASSYEVPDIIPPMVVSDGPDGIHTDSPYGPWEVKPPYAGAYEISKKELHASDEMVARAGGFDHLVEKLLATPYPPMHFLQARPSMSPLRSH